LYVTATKTRQMKNGLKCFTVADASECFK